MWIAIAFLCGAGAWFFSTEAIGIGPDKPLVTCLTGMALAQRTVDEQTGRTDRSGLCHEADPLGGWGIQPKRRYVLAYDGSFVCGLIRDALNQAIADGTASLRKVMRPLRKAGQDAGSVPGAASEYEAKNPIFADDMFLSWSYLDGAAQMSPSGGDVDRARWLVAPIMNDQHRYLVTRDWHGPVVMWDVPDDQLDQRVGRVLGATPYSDRSQ